MTASGPEMHVVGLKNRHKTGGLEACFVGSGAYCRPKPRIAETSPGARGERRRATVRTSEEVSQKPRLNGSVHVLAVIRSPEW